MRGRLRKGRPSLIRCALNYGRPEEVRGRLEGAAERVGLPVLQRLLPRRLGEPTEQRLDEVGLSEHQSTNGRVHRLIRS